MGAGSLIMSLGQSFEEVLKPSVRKRILLMEAESIFLMDLALLREAVRPDVTIISNSKVNGKNKLIFLRLGEKDLF